MIEQTKFKVGQVWEDRRGELNIIQHIGSCNMLVKGCDSYFNTSEYHTWPYNLDGSYGIPPTEYDLVCLVRDVVPENQATQTDIQLKIQQIEQQLQELKALLKD